MSTTLQNYFPGGAGAAMTGIGSIVASASPVGAANFPAMKKKRGFLPLSLHANNSRRRMRASRRGEPDALNRSSGGDFSLRPRGRKKPVRGAICAKVRKTFPAATSAEKKIRTRNRPRRTARRHRREQHRRTGESTPGERRFRLHPAHTNGARGPRSRAGKSSGRTGRPEQGSRGRAVFSGLRPRAARRSRRATAAR